MENPVAGVEELRKKSAGSISLQLSDGGMSPILEAHPGSPVDLSRRSSLARSTGSQHGEEVAQQTIGSPGKEEATRRGGVAAKGYFSTSWKSEVENAMTPVVGIRGRNSSFVTGDGPQGRRVPFYIPARVPEQEELHTVSPTSIRRARGSVDTIGAASPIFDFETDKGEWISASSQAHDSRTSLATTNITNILTDDRSVRTGALTLDTSVASSAASMVSSSAASTYSATTTVSSDIYGWEEELDRKMSIENQNWEPQAPNRRLPSGGRTRRGPRLQGGAGLNDLNYKRADGKRKSLLYRVLNISGSKGREAINPSIETLGSIPQETEDETTAVDSITP